MLRGPNWGTVKRTAQIYRKSLVLEVEPVLLSLSMLK